MTLTMEKISLSSKRFEEPEFDLREWGLKAKISRENTKSRRFSASNIASFREETRSFRSNVSFSSPASPGYPLGDEIDPSTYSFTTALKALQARTGHGWEALSPDHGFALSSKWNDAEKYICNPLSGEFPVECLSTKTLSGRFMSIPTTISRTIAMSTTHAKAISSKTCLTQENNVHEFLIQDKKMKKSTRDVGTQSTPPDHSSSSPSPASTPSITERPLKHFYLEDGESSNSTYSTSVTEIKHKSSDESEENEMREIETGAEEDERKEEEEDKEMCKCKQEAGGCLSWIVWMRRRQRGKHKPRRKVLFGNSNKKIEL